MYGIYKSAADRGWGPFKQQWYSICSVHRVSKSTCSNCQVGHWIPVWRNRASIFFHKYCYWLWFIVANHFNWWRWTKRFFNRS